RGPAPGRNPGRRHAVHDPAGGLLRAAAPAQRPGRPGGGTAVPQPPHEALEKVMGFFVNLLPLRRRLDPSMPFLRLVEEVKAGVVEAFEYPDLPFERLVRELQVPRDPSRSPVYQA